MTNGKPVSSVWKDWGAAMLCLALVLGFIFRQSFDSEKVLFANDAPLGLISSDASRAASDFKGMITGFWQDLNWVGIDFPSVSLGLSSGMFQLFGQNPITNAKFYTPLSFAYLGFCAWLLFRTFGFRPVVCVIGALAAALNMNSFSHGAWGLPGRALSWGSAMLAIAALYSSLQGRAWIKAILAGMCVGLGVVEAYDVGGLYSLYVAAFGIFLAFAGKRPREAGKGLVLVAVVTVSAALFSAQTLATLVNTQVKGVAGMQQDEKTKSDRWDEATAWSLPKTETLRVIIPGLFGYRMDTPEGGMYWGSVGFPAYQRHSGAGEYAGVFVVLVALWGAANVLRKKNPVYSDLDRRVVIFWTVAAIVSILFAWGRWAPFYQILYKLPFFSTIRNPIKFMHFFHLSLVILFGYGLQVIFKYYIDPAAEKSVGPMEQFKKWWAKAAPFDQRAALLLGAGLGISLLGFFAYSSYRPQIVKYLETVGFPAPFSGEIAAHSFHEAGSYLIFYVASLAIILLCLCGFFSGARARVVGFVIGALVVIDLGRANQPWIQYLNYKQIYAPNSVFEFLRQRSVDNRVTLRVAPFAGMTFLSPQNPELKRFMEGVFSEWSQSQFQYYNIRSIDIIQMPRMQELDAQYRAEFTPRQNELYRGARLWQLANTRYIIGQKEYLQELNATFDPVEKRFQIATNFDLVPKPGLKQGAGITQNDVTFELSPNGQFAIFEYPAALPRYKLFSQWQVAADDASSLATLSSLNFDPLQKVVLNEPGFQASTASTNAGTATLVKYKPKEIEVKTDAPAPSVLLWNDRWSENWHAYVDGQPVKLLRANFIMRGIPVPAGPHTVVMRYAQPARAPWISFATMIVGVGLCCFLAFSRRQQP